MNILNNKEIKKGKIAVTITIGIMCALLTIVIFIQFRTISETNISELEIAQDSELRKEIEALKSKCDEVNTKTIEVDKKILEYAEAISQKEDASKILEKELNEIEGIIGKNKVKGPGVIITIEDGEVYKVVADDLLFLVNILKSAGAEAISINEERIVYDSYITDIEMGRILTVKGKVMKSPFNVKAIGDAEAIEEGLKIYEYIEDMKISGKKVTIERLNNIQIPAHNKSLEFEYVKEEEE